MPTSPGNPFPLLPIDKPNTIGQIPASGPPISTFSGIRTLYPIQKLFLTGSVRRDNQGIDFGPCAASTTYANWVLIPRAALITAVFLVLQTVPTGGTATVAVTYNGVSLLSTANVSTIGLTAGVIYSLPIATTPLSLVPANLDFGSPLPYITSANGPAAGAGVGYPYPVLVTYAEGATTVHSSNILVSVEYEQDDFNG